MTPHLPEISDLRRASTRYRCRGDCHHDGLPIDEGHMHVHKLQCYARIAVVVGAVLFSARIFLPESLPFSCTRAGRHDSPSGSTKP